MDNESLAELQARLSERRTELEEMKASLPAHTIRPHQMIRIEETEDDIRELERQIAELAAGSGE
ncbi:MAG: hypothetical protein M5U22_06375 [Thermoleophilia bacterium]|nr:hypothetical protein [Thermoleophilia bacterium]